MNRKGLTLLHHARGDEMGGWGGSTTRGQEPRGGGIGGGAGRYAVDCGVGEWGEEEEQERSGRKEAEAEGTAGRNQRVICCADVKLVEVLESLGSNYFNYGRC